MRHAASRTVLTPPVVIETRTRVLYVEDVAELRPLIVAALDAARFRVIVAGGVDAALFLASRERFDAVVCGDPATARALFEFTSGWATRMIVITRGDGQGAAAVPPGTAVLRAPTAEELRVAVCGDRAPRPRL
jgi:hypothetical protein